MEAYDHGGALSVLSIDGIDDIHNHLGRELGPSSWVEITQELIEAFAAVTGDVHFLHMDPERAAQSQFGGTIAHGLLTLGLGTQLSAQLYRFEHVAVVVNYGYDRIRFPAPVPVDTRVRMRATIASVDTVSRGVQVKIVRSFEREGEERPVCVAEAIVRVYAE
jgi:acyl dehydratase